MYEITRISWAKVKEENRPLHSAGNAGAVTTLTLFYQALHDCYGFGKVRLERLWSNFQETYNTLSYRRNVDTYRQLINGIGAGLNQQTYNDICRRMPRVIETDDTYPTVVGKELRYNHKEKDEVSESTDVVYIMVLYLLKKTFKLNDADLIRIQRKIKFYVRCISDKDVRIVEYMQCLNHECRIKFAALNTYKKHKKLHIYG